MKREVYKHDCRPYLLNELCTVDEYDYANPHDSKDWPEQYRHPLGCKITYDSEAVVAFDCINAALHLKKIEELMK